MKLITNPIMEHQLTLMRDKNSNTQLFRSCIHTLAQFMAYEVTKDIKIKNKKIVTPIGPMVGKELDEHIVLVPILRAGLGIVDSFKDMIPKSRIGHIGLYRDEKTHKPVEYYCKMPTTIKGSTVILLDPMLATGHSGADAITMIKRYKPRRIKFVSIVSCPEGIKYVESKHPDVECFTAAIDKKLNKDKYIVPGLGDAGDRIFGTK